MRPLTLGFLLVLLSATGAARGQEAAVATGAPNPSGDAAADGPASLIADSVSFDRETGVLVASGAVEVLYQGRVLRATRVIYDQKADEVRIEGPLTLTDTGGGVIIADSAALTPDLTRGIIDGARLLIAGRLQLAAVEARKEGDRYAVLDKVIASTCTICAGSSTPTWAIRAARVTRDAAEQRLYFKDARVEVFGVPVAWSPRLSIPEPGVNRASGLLVPQFLSSDIYGLGAKVPYYRVISPSSDVTLTPFVTTKGGVLLEGEYRQRFDNGGFNLWGTVTLDNSLAGQAGRGAIFANGAFRLPSDYRADFQFQVASDDSFLAQYDYSEADRLTNYARIYRTRLNSYIELGTVAFQSLRTDEDPATVPFIIPEFSYRKLINSPETGGRIGINAQSLGVVVEDGTNMVRVGGGVDWTRDWTLPQGVLAEVVGSAVLDVYQVWDDPGQPEGTQARGMPLVSGKLSWPLARIDAGGAQHVITPIAQVIYSKTLGQAFVPNEDSQLPEFDETNLFSLNRFPGEDRLETGLRANVGVAYTRYDPAGWSLGALVGRIASAKAEDYGDGFVVPGGWSDYVGAIYLDFANGLGVVNRALFGADLDFRRNEFALNYDQQWAGLTATYIYTSQSDFEPFLGPQPTTSELSLDGRYRIRPNWELSGIWRYDFELNSNLRAGAGIAYGNECAEVDLSVLRRYTYTDDVPPSTTIGFNVRFSGFGSNGDRAWPARVCTSEGTL